MGHIIKNLIIASIFFSTISCSNAEKDTTVPGRNSTKNIENKLIQANKELVKSEDDDIRSFIKRYGWEMNETGTGLRIMVYQQGVGDLIKPGQRVIITYQVFNLSGDIIYDKHYIGEKAFICGKGGVESGIEEAILLMNKGAKAKIILPSHLAFGLPGDGNKIPPKATLVYDIEVIETLK